MNIFSLIKKSKHFKYLIKYSFLIIILIELQFIKIKKLPVLHSDKWIVMNAYNPPFPSLFNLLTILEDWKMVVISINNKTSFSIVI